MSAPCVCPVSSRVVFFLVSVGGGGGIECNLVFKSLFPYFFFLILNSFLQFQPHLHHMRVSIFTGADGSGFPRTSEPWNVFSFYCSRTAFKISLPPVLKAKKKKQKVALWWAALCFPILLQPALPGGRCSHPVLVGRSWRAPQASHVPWKGDKHRVNAFCLMF